MVGKAVFQCLECRCDWQGYFIGDARNAEGFCPACRSECFAVVAIVDPSEE